MDEQLSRSEERERIRESELTEKESDREFAGQHVELLPGDK